MFSYCLLKYGRETKYYLVNAVGLFSKRTMTPRRWQTAEVLMRKAKQNELSLQIGFYLTLRTHVRPFLDTVFELKSVIPRSWGWMFSKIEGVCRNVSAVIRVWNIHLLLADGVLSFLLITFFFLIWYKMLSLFVFWVQCFLMAENDLTKGLLLKQDNLGF